MTPTEVHELTVETALAEVLTESPASIAQRVGAAYERFAAPFNKRLVLCGAGHLGRVALPGVRAAGIEPVAFCDNNPNLHGTWIDGVPVLSPAGAVALHGGDAAFLVTVYHPSAFRQQLVELGCARIVPYAAFYWKHWRALGHEERLDIPQRIVTARRDIEAAFALLSDNKSRADFCGQIRWRCLLDESALPPHEPMREMYFPRDLFRPSSDEIFADCGAFDGDTIRALLERTGGRFRRIYAFEPDAVNRAALARYLETLPHEDRVRVELFPIALGASECILRFNAQGTMLSRPEQNGAVGVTCRTLDNALAGREHPTFIKMDIEGGEPDAIAGATETIRRARPIMAVCAYHRTDHLWRLPLMLHAANPDYLIFLRRYTEECWESACYAVPPERAAASNTPDME